MNLQEEEFQDSNLNYPELETNHFTDEEEPIF
jgi:hypothetical protein